MIDGASGLAGLLAEALTDDGALREEAGRAQAFASRQSGAVETASARLLDLLGRPL
jgi:hypothetical protein